VLLSLLAACAPLSLKNGVSAPPARSSGEIVVGVSAALAGEGIAPLGIDILRGVQLAVQARSPLSIDGYDVPVSLITQDDECSPEGGQAAASRFVADERVAAVIGPMCSSGCRAAIPIFDAAGITTISPSCTNADLTTRQFLSFNRTVVSDAVQGIRTAEYIYDTLGLTRIATLSDGSPYGEGLVQVVTSRFLELGGRVVADDVISVGDTDYRALLEDIAQEAPELIYFVGFAPEGARLVEQRIDIGLESVVFMSADGLRNQDFVALAGRAAEGAYATVSVPVEGPSLADFLDGYQRTFGERPPGPYHTHAYDAAQIILDAVVAASTRSADGTIVTDRVLVASYVRNLREYQGLTGRLSANGRGELISDARIEISCVVDRAFVALARGEACPVLIGHEGTGR
jgi:branched-chain amino acid transport system substrate-binding protein